MISMIDAMALIIAGTGIILLADLFVVGFMAYWEDRKLSNMPELERYEYLIDKYGYHWQEHL